MRLLSGVLLLCAVAGAESPAARAVANRPVIDMFSRASEDADVVSQAIFGTNVEILESTEGWWRIRTPDQYTGWVQSALFAPADKPYATSGKIAEVTNLFAHLYREQSVTKHRPVVTVPFETRLELGPGESERWLEVVLPDRRSVWIQRGDVNREPQSAALETMLDVGKRFLGLPYTWGGTSAYGYDCSGFTQMLERRRGIVMPRDAHLQAAWEGVSAVEKEALLPGDLLFFGSSQEKITHTGMYLGAGEFIHATTHERPVVQISKLADPYWTRLLVCARRPK